MFRIRIEASGWWRSCAAPQLYVCGIDDHRSGIRPNGHNRPCVHRSLLGSNTHRNSLRIQTSWKVTR